VAEGAPCFLPALVDEGVAVLVLLSVCEGHADIIPRGYSQVGGVMSDIGTASSATPLLNVLLPVLVGGAIGIIGSFLGPLFLQRAKDAVEKKRKRAEKFEELVAALGEHFYWIDTLRNYAAFGSGNEPTLSPIVKMQAIEEFIQQLEVARRNYHNWALDVGQKRLRGDAGYANLTDHEDALNKYMEKRQALLAEFRSFARREFH
jgi:hypothetical protein